MKKIISIICFILLSVSSIAEIKVYDGHTGGNKDLDFLLNQVPEISEELSKKTNSSALKSQKKIIVEKIIKQMNKTPEENKNLLKEEQPKLGTLVVFADILTINDQVLNSLNKLESLKDIGKIFYLKEPISPLSFMTFAVQTGGKVNMKFKLDSNEKVAKKLRVSSYPCIIYITPFKERVKFNLTSGGITALKIYIGEVFAKLKQ